MKRNINNTIVGVVAVLVLFASVAMITVFAWPWWPNKGDAPYHADYVYQLYNGKLPDWNEGIQYPAFKEKIESPETGYPGDYKHIASPHPPLFYAIQAPFMGPLLNAGEWEKALAVGRTINVVLGMILGALMAYAAWLFGGKYRDKLAIMVPLFGLLTSVFIYLGNRFMNDIPVIIFATLTMILVYHIYKNGLSLRKVLLFAVILALGMLSKATFVTVLIPAYLLMAYVVYRDRIKSKKRMVLYLAIPVVIVILMSGWFYARNFLESGDVTRTGSQEWVADRKEPKAIGDVLTDSSFYALFYKSFTSPELSTVLTTAIVVSLLYIYSDHKRKYKNLILRNKPLFIMFAGIASLLILAQIKHAVPYGSYGLRYLMPFIFPAAFISAFALIKIPVLGKYWGVIVAILMTYSVLVSYSINSLTLYTRHTVVGRLEESFSANYISGIFLYVLLLSGALALMVILYSLRKMRSK